MNSEEGTKLLRTNNAFQNLKSDYFLAKIFDYMKQYNTLKILNYNKYLQKRINLSINDYNEYFISYSPIKLELTCIENKYGIFINIPYEEKEYYKIYFDESKMDKKRNYLIESEKVAKIRIKIGYQIKSFIEN